MNEPGVVVATPQGLSLAPRPSSGWRVSVVTTTIRRLAGAWPAPGWIPHSTCSCRQPKRGRFFVLASTGACRPTGPLSRVRRLCSVNSRWR
jgi:hypothetical protein